MYNAIHEEKYKDYKIEIIPDRNPIDPREDDNLGTMICFHREYDLGDKVGYNSKDFENWEEIEQQIKKDFDPVIMLPLYLYNHGVLRMKIGSFEGILPQGHARFDSGKIGYIVVSKEKMKKAYKVNRITKKLKDEAIKFLKYEVENYDKYIAGMAVGYVVKKGEDIIGSCYGFCDIDEAIENAKGNIDYILERKRKEKQEK